MTAKRRFSACTDPVLVACIVQAMAMLAGSGYALIKQEMVLAGCMFAGALLVARHYIFLSRSDHVAAAGEFLTAIRRLEPSQHYRHADTRTILVRTCWGRLFWAVESVTTVAESDLDDAEQAPGDDRVAVIWRDYWTSTFARSVYTAFDGTVFDRRGDDHAPTARVSAWKRLCARLRFINHLRASPAETRDVTAMLREAQRLHPDHTG